MDYKKQIAAVVMAVACVSGQAQVIVPPHLPVSPVAVEKAPVQSKTYGSIDEYCAEYQAQMKHATEAARNAQKSAKSANEASQDPNAPDPAIMKALCSATKMLRADNTSRLPRVYGNRPIMRW